MYITESIVMLGYTPKLRQLQLLKFPDGTELRIMDKVAPKWDEVAIALGFDGAQIETIEIGAYYQPRNACRKMFTGWLAGGHDLKPPTWDVLVQSLRAAKLTELADVLDSTIEIVSFKPNDHVLSSFLIIIQEAEDASASTLSVDTESQVSSSTATPDVINDNVKGIP